MHGRVHCYRRRRHVDRQRCATSVGPTATRQARVPCHLVNVDWTRRQRYLPTGDSESFVTYTVALRRRQDRHRRRPLARTNSSKPNWVVPPRAGRLDAPYIERSTITTDWRQTDWRQTSLSSPSVRLSARTVGLHVSQPILIADWTATRRRPIGERCARVVGGVGESDRRRWRHESWRCEASEQSHTSRVDVFIEVFFVVVRQSMAKFINFPEDESKYRWLVPIDNRIYEYIGTGWTASF